MTYDLRVNRTIILLCVLFFKGLTIVLLQSTAVSTRVKRHQIYLALGSQSNQFINYQLNDVILYRISLRQIFFILKIKLLVDLTRILLQTLLFIQIITRSAAYISNCVLGPIYDILSSGNEL